MGAIFAPAVGAVCPLTDDMNEYETENEWTDYYSAMVLTAPMPAMKSVYGRNFAKGMDNDQKAEYIDRLMDEKRRSRKQKKRRNATFGCIALMALLSFFDVTFGHSLLIAGLAGTTALVETNHRWTPSKDRNGNTWVATQSDIINSVMSKFESGDIAGAIRLMVVASAGAGKTTLICGICEGFANAIRESPENALSLSLIAFNKDIATELGDGVVKPILSTLKDSGVTLDWSAKTLNSWGWRMVDESLKTLHPNGKVGMTKKNRSLPFIRTSIMNVIANQPSVCTEWLSMLPRSKFDETKPDFYRGISKTQSAFEKIVIAAMNEGCLIDGSGFDWTTFIADKRYDLIDSDEVPFGEQMLLYLKETVERAIKLSMNALTPSGVKQRIEPSSTARLWLWDEPNAAGKEIIATRFNGNRYKAVKSWISNGLTENYLAWTKGMYYARDCTDDMLIAAGMLYEPTEVEFVAGHDTQIVTESSGDSISIVQHYQGRNMYGKATGYIQIKPSFYTKGTPFDDIIKSINFGNSHGSKVVGYGALVGSKNYNQRASGLFPTNVGGGDWIYAIKNTPEVIVALCDRLKSSMDIDAHHLFAGDSSPDTVDANVITGFDVRFDFTDQIYAPCYHGWSLDSKLDCIMVDEFQDMSSLKHMMLEKIVKADGHIICVGDPKQSIYGFAGSHADSIGAGVERFNMDEMPMNHCFRQTHTLSKEVRDLMGTDLDGNITRFMSHESPDMIESWPNGESSQVVTHGVAADMLQAGDMVLNTMSAQLVIMALDCLRMGKKVAIAGGGKMESKIRFESLSLLANDVDCTPRAFESALADKKAKLLVKLEGNYAGDVTKAKNDEKYAQFEDIEASIMALIEQWFTSGSTTEFVAKDGSDWLQELFGDDDDEAIMFSTIHRCKGLEFERVFLLCDRVVTDEEGDDKLVSNWMWSWVCHDDKGVQEHLNIIYVALTRAKTTNVYVSAHAATATHARDAMWVLDDYTQDHRDTDDDGGIADDDDDNGGDGYTPESFDDNSVIDDEMSIIEHEFEAEIFDEIVEHIEGVESTETVEEVVEATPDELEATEMSKFAIIKRVTGFENQGVLHECALLTNDLDDVKQYLDTVLPDDVIAQLKPGEYYQSSHNSFNLYSVWMTDYEMPEYVEIAISNHHDSTLTVVDYEIMNDDDVEPVVEVVEPVVDETPTRSRKSQTERVDDMVMAFESITFDGKSTCTIGEIADNMACSVDTVKRVLENASATDVEYEESANGDEAWVSLTIRHTFVVECERSATGRFARGSEIWFTKYVTPEPVFEIPEEVIEVEESVSQHVFKLVENAGMDDERIVEDYHPETALSYNATNEEGNDGKLMSARNYLKACALNLHTNTKTLTIFWSDGEIVSHWSVKDIDMASLNPDGSDRCKEGFAAGYHHALNLVANLTNMDVALLRGADFDLTEDSTDEPDDDEDRDDGGITYPTTEDLEHKTAFDIDDDPEGKYKDNTRYRCPHPICSTITAVKVENGEDFCEHRHCTWVETDCSNCFESMGRCECSDDDDGGITEDSNDDDDDGQRIKSFMRQWGNDDAYWEKLHDEHPERFDDNGIYHPPEEPSGLERIFTEDSPEIDDEEAKEYQCSVCQTPTGKGRQCPFYRVDGCTGKGVEVVETPEVDDESPENGEEPVQYEAGYTSPDEEIYFAVIDDVDVLKSIWSEDWAIAHAGQVYRLKDWYVNHRHLSDRWAVCSVEESNSDSDDGKFPPHCYRIISKADVMMQFPMKHTTDETNYIHGEPEMDTLSLIDLEYGIKVSNKVMGMACFNLASQLDSSKSGDYHTERVDVEESVVSMVAKDDYQLFMMNNMSPKYPAYEPSKYHSEDRTILLGIDTATAIFGNNSKSLTKIFKSPVTIEGGLNNGWLSASCANATKQSRVHELTSDLKDIHIQNPSTLKHTIGDVIGEKTTSELMIKKFMGADIKETKGEIFSIYVDGHIISVDKKMLKAFVVCLSGSKTSGSYLTFSISVNAGGCAYLVIEGAKTIDWAWAVEGVMADPDSEIHFSV